ncbi:MAG: DUF1624 domain-containing protein [Flavisolibacter sp.]
MPAVKELQKKRISSIDQTRGLVMVIMALDHVRDLLHLSSIGQSPTNLQTTTPLIFFTRWITYICAPSFVFLAGTSAYLSFKRKNDAASARRFLLKRGIYLVALEFTVVNFIMYFDPGFHTLIFEVIAAIGFGFIVLSLLIRSRPVLIGAVGLVIIFLHNLVPFVPATGNRFLDTAISLLFNPGGFPFFTNRVFVMAYPPLPWLGIMLVGFACGQFFEQEKRKALFLKIGLSAICFFILLRYLNFYGDPVPWTLQRNETFTFLSFMNVAKYPPSFLFCLITLGMMFVVLAFSEGSQSRILNTLSVYGRVPLFYFLAHFFLIHLILVAVLLLQGFHWDQLDFASGNFGRPKQMVSGIHLWQVYLVWIGVVIMLYWPCRWFGRFKSTHSYWWLPYM